MLDKLLERKVQNRIIYTICFFLFMVIDHRVKTVPTREGWLFAWQNMLAIVVVLLIITHYKWQDFTKYKLVYILWSIVGGGIGIAYYLWCANQTVFYKNATIVMVIDIILMGYIVIHTFIDRLVEKKELNVDKKILIAWLIMMLLMIFSRSEYMWPLGYCIVFGCFYFTDFSKEEIHDMMCGASDGIILSFLVTQGAAFVFRPYETWTVRYMGMYTNPNQNALFYLCALSALLIKGIYYKRQSKKIGYAICLLLIIGVLDLIILTLGRTALVVAFLLMLLFLKIIYGKLFKFQTIRNALLMVGVMIIVFPLCFASVRYIPAVFHHPIWFDGEWAERRVHSWDSWDSEKYITFEQYLAVALGRFRETINSSLSNSPLKLDVDAAELNEEEKPTPILTKEEAVDTVLVRKIIYENYLRRLNLRGHPYHEQGIQLTEKTFTYHAHNFYLQYGTDFGIPVMILLILLVLWSGCIYGKRVYKEANIEDITLLMLILIPSLYGILEYSWGVGSIGTTMLFIAWRVPKWKE